MYLWEARIFPYWLCHQAVFRSRLTRIERRWFSHSKGRDGLRKRQSSKSVHSLLADMDSSKG